MLYGAQIETIDPSEVIRIDGVQRKIIGDGDGSDHRVVGTSLGLSADAAKGGRDTPKGSSWADIERQWLEVGLGLLNLSLARRPLLAVRHDERPNRQLGQGYRRDEWLCR